MKILRITFENIHSLYGVHSIDWEAAPLKDEGLFLITGPTGAGKSTLLDVMTLALYNKIARLPSLSKNVIENTGSIVTHGCDRAFAEVTYSCSKGIFRSRWSIKKNRNGSFNDHQMELFSGAVDSERIESQNTNVLRKNTELVGLDFEQFTRAIMLAQGDFAQLLKAKKNERGELLEKITGTSIYSLLGSRCYEIEDALRKDVKQLQSSLESIQLLSPEMLTLRNEQRADIKRRQQLNEVKINTLDKKYSIARKIKDTEEKWLLAQSEFSLAENSEAKFNAEKLPELQGYECLQPLLEPITQVRHRRDGLKKLNDQKVRTEETARSIDNHKNQWKEEVISFVKNYLPENDPELQLQQFRDAVLEQERKVQAAAEQEQKDVQRLREFYPRLEQDWKNIVANGLDPALERFETIEEQLRVQHKSLGENLNDLLAEDPDKKLAELQKRSSGLASLQVNISEYEKKLEDGKKLKTDIAAAEQKEQGFRLEYEKSKTKTETLFAQLSLLRDRLGKQMLSRNLEEQRKHLKEGDACPLCGSLDHPFVQHYQDLVDDLTKDLKQLENDWKQSSLEEKSFLTQQTSTKERLQNLLQDIQDLELEKKRLAADISTIKAEHKFEFSYAEDRGWPKREGDRIQKQYEDLDLYLRTERRLKQLSDLIALLKSGLDSRQRHASLKQVLNDLYQGDAIGLRVDNLLKRWNTLLQQAAQNNATSEELNKQIPSETNKLLLQEQALQEQLQEAGFASLEEAIAARITDETYQKLKSDQQRLKVLLLSAFNKNEELRKEFDSLKSDAPVELLEELEIQLFELRNERDALLKDLGSIEKELELNEQLRERMTLQVKELEEKTMLQRRWEKLNRIIGDKTGKVFRNYAQQLTLRQLLFQANIYLKSLFGRYQFEIPTETDFEELRIIDEDLANTVRSVNTLSGGETFLASLALALGLSDMAARSTKLECLFIDEGFGTLDPDSLEIAISTLENLRIKDNKVIGIISHLEQLRERIPIKIKVLRNQEGFSRIEVGV